MIEGENFSQSALAARNTTQRKNKNSRRFSDEQIRSLESLFKLEAKLEPRKKLQMAGELGLQPRQVAIWFQNKRARWKSKQIEQEYRSLKDDYDELNSRFESLKKEKQSLIIQVNYSLPPLITYYNPKFCFFFFILEFNLFLVCVHAKDLS